MRTAKCFICVLLAVGLSVSAGSAEPVPTEVLVYHRSVVDDAFAKGWPLQLNNKIKVQTGNRVGPDEAEFHEKDTDIFYILDGEATIVNGGDLSGAKKITPGELCAKTILGGTNRTVGKGDVIIIPFGTPHQFATVSGHILYFVVKITN